MKSDRTMRKIYIQPINKIVEAETESLICGSDDIHTDQGINYGGVDEGGVKDPDARESLFGGDGTWDEW